MQPLPNYGAPFVNTLRRLIPPWNFYLQQFTQAPAAILAVSVGTSPFAYQAKEPGYLYVIGGIVGGIVLTRGKTSLTLTGEKIIPVGINDLVTITYTGLPTVSFAPSYGSTPA